MLASPVPIYLGCVGLIVGGLGLAAQHMLAGKSVNATTAERPSFARSVDEGSPTPDWPAKGVAVPHYQSSVELLTSPTQPAQSSLAAATPQRNPPQTPQPAQPQAPQQTQAPQKMQEPQQAAPREVVRDVTQPPLKPARRGQRNRDEIPADQAMASTEQADPGATRKLTRRERREQERLERQERREQARQRHAAQTETDGREGGSRRFDRRVRDWDEERPVDRSRFDRRQTDRDDRPQRDSERRVIVREGAREPAPHIVRGAEQRDGGFTPFRLFGIFER